MTHKEYSDLLSGATDPDKVAGIIVSVLDGLKEDLGIKDALEQSNKELTEQNNMLRDTNAKLALRITGEPDKPDNPPDEKELTPQEALEKLVTQIREDK